MAHHAIHHLVQKSMNWMQRIVAQTSRIELLCHPSILSVGTQQTLVVSGVKPAQPVSFLAVPDSTSSKVIKYVEFNQLFSEARFFNTPLLLHLAFFSDPSFSGDNNYEWLTNANTTGLSSCCYALQGINQNLHLFAYQYTYYASCLCLMLPLISSCKSTLQAGTKMLIPNYSFSLQQL